MRANPNTSELSTLKIAGASVLGLAFSFGFTSQQGHGGAVFSLFNEGNLFRDSGALLFFRLAVFACLLLLPFQRRLFAIMGTFILVSWVVLYSFVGAFIFPLITSCAFFYFAFRQSRAELKAGAALMLALPFLLSVIHKMHPGYLRGTEFSNGGSFFMFLYSWGFSPTVLTQNISEALAAISLVVELGLFVGLLYRTTLFAHLALLFALTLAIAHPPVLFVYGFFFPFALLVDDDWANDLGKGISASALSHSFFWCAAAVFFAIKATDFSMTAVKVWPVAAFLIFYHLRRLGKLRKATTPYPRYLDLLRSPRSLIAPILVVVTFMASALGAPAPLGFSMFSSRDSGKNRHVLYVPDRDTCRQILKQWMFSAVVDAGAHANADGTCTLTFPTLSGLQGMKDRLCSMNPQSVWSTREKGADFSTPEICGRPQSEVE